MAAGRLINAVEHRQLHHPPVQNHARILKSLNVWGLSRPNTTHPEQNQTLEAPGLHLLAAFWEVLPIFYHFVLALTWLRWHLACQRTGKAYQSHNLGLIVPNATTLFNIFQRDCISVRPYLAVYEDFYHRRHAKKQRFLGMPP